MFALHVDIDTNVCKKYQLRDFNFRENKFQLKELERVNVYCKRVVAVRIATVTTLRNAFPK